jgi:CubicO group peptidase (beta-lactamase class C family)
MKKRSLRVLIFSLVCLLAIALMMVIRPPMPERGDFQTFTQYLEEQIPEQMSKYHVAGLSVALVHDSQLEYLQGFGYADEGKSTPITGDTLFQVASISKAVSAWGVMNLVEEGKIDLDAPASNYLTRWQFPATKYDLNQVTIRRMLSHTSGIAHVGGYAGVSSIAELQSLEESLTSPNDAESKGVRVVYTPGSKYQYSGGAYTLLQLIIEEVSGQAFSDYMKTQVLDPIGMTASTFESTPPAGSSVSSVFNQKGQTVPSHYFSSKAAAGLYSSAHDMAMFEKAMMLTGQDAQNENVLSAETLREMYQPQPGLSQLLPYGLGYMLQPLRSIKTIEVSHTGSNLPGWNSLITTLPEKGEGLVILTNSPGGNQLRESLRSRWLYWATGQISNSSRMNKLIQTLMIVVPIWIIGVLLLFFVPRISQKNKNKKTKS